MDDPEDPDEETTEELPVLEGRIRRKDPTLWSTTPPRFSDRVYDIGDEASYAKSFTQDFADYIRHLTEWGRHDDVERLLRRR